MQSALQVGQPFKQASGHLPGHFKVLIGACVSLYTHIYIYIHVCILYMYMCEAGLGLRGDCWCIYLGERLLTR